MPDGTWHLDLMIWPTDEPGSAVTDPARPLVTFRLPARTALGPHESGCMGFEAEPIDDHRAVYLDHEGPVSGGRGVLTRLAWGKRGTVRRPPVGEAGNTEIRVEGNRFRARGSGAIGGVLLFERAE